MTAVTETYRKIMNCGDIKKFVIKSNAVCATGFTIDLDSDATDAKGVEMSEVTGIVVRQESGVTRTATVATATGIITLGTLTTGIHFIEVTGY